MSTATPAATRPSVVATAADLAAPPRFHFAPAQLVLAAVLLAEVVVFGLLGENFLTAGNLLTVLRQNAELGLVALALTPVILTGGIDLSVGSLMGLSAVLFGALWRAGLPPAAACAVVLAAATACGGLNALLVTRGRIPPLIVTLGTFSLFRGVAEGMAGGQASYVGFPESFLLLGQGAFLGVPTQLWILAPAAVGFYLLVHRSTAGRALSAIGYAPDGARHAGIRVGRLTGLTYVAAGFCAGLAGLIYVARFGQAKADAATAYELAAITAVVLGGTSIFGGRASVAGTLLGLLAVAFLENGQALAGSKRELTGILVGVLLLAAVGLDFTRRRSRPRVAPAASSGGQRSGTGTSEELDMRNSQLAVLCAVILAAALIIVGGNLFVVNAIKGELRASARSAGGGSGGGNGADPTAGGGTGGAPAAAKRVVIGMMPKSKGNAYFIACQRGAEEAVTALNASGANVELLWDGPTSADPAEQNKIVETWVTRRVDAIAVAVENAGGLSTALRKARAAGIKVVTWDADAEPDARDVFCNQATPAGIGGALMDEAAKAMGGGDPAAAAGRFVVISGSRTAANLNLWLDAIRARRAAAYPRAELAEVVYCDDKQNVALDLGKQMLNKYPDLKLIVANCSPAVPGGAEAVKQSGRANVKVVGLGLPNENKRYVHDGVTAAVVLWKTADLGYLTVHAALAAVDGSLKGGATTFAAGRLGPLNIEGSDILLGKPFVFTKDNIDQFDF